MLPGFEDFFLFLKFFLDMSDMCFVDALLVLGYAEDTRGFYPFDGYLPIRYL